jgi:hypothetical protein
MVPCCRRKLLLLEMLDEQRKCAVEDLRRITVGNRVAEQILRPAQPVMRLASDGDLNLIALRCDRRDYLAYCGRYADRRRGAIGAAMPASVFAWSTGIARGGVIAGRTDGSLRTDATTSGWGRMAATISSTSRFVLKRAASRTRVALSDVR